LWRARGLDHPLAASQLRDLCPLLPAPPPSLGVLRKVARQNSSMSSSCDYFGGGNQPQLSVTLMSTRQLSEERPASSQTVFRDWMAEVQASYGQSGEAAGNWRQSGTWRAGKQESLLFEDHGVMVLLESGWLDAGALAEHARRVQAALRHPPEK